MNCLIFWVLRARREQKTDTVKSLSTTQIIILKIISLIGNIISGKLNNIAQANSFPLFGLAERNLIFARFFYKNGESVNFWKTNHWIETPFWIMKKPILCKKLHAKMSKSFWQIYAGLWTDSNSLLHPKKTQLRRRDIYLWYNRLKYCETNLWFCLEKDKKSTNEFFQWKVSPTANKNNHWLKLKIFTGVEWYSKLHEKLKKNVRVKTRTRTCTQSFRKLLSYSLCCEFFWQNLTKTLKDGNVLYPDLSAT